MRKNMGNTVKLDNSDFIEALESEDYVIPPNLDYDTDENNSIWTVVDLDDL